MIMTVPFPGIPLSPAQFWEHSGCSANIWFPPLPGCLVTSVTLHSGRLEIHPTGCVLLKPCPHEACICVTSATEIRAWFSWGGSEKTSSNRRSFFLTSSKLATLPSPYPLTPNRTELHLWAGIHLHHTERRTAWTLVSHRLGLKPELCHLAAVTVAIQGSPEKQTR